MTKTIYRVECNHGSKYFTSGIEAFAYFQKMCRQEQVSVELWLIVKEITPKLFSVRQELIACN